MAILMNIGKEYVIISFIEKSILFIPMYSYSSKNPIFEEKKKKLVGALNNFQMGFDSVADPPKLKVAVKTAF